MDFPPPTSMRHALAGLFSLDEQCGGPHARRNKGRRIVNRSFQGGREEEKEGRDGAADCRPSDHLLKGLTVSFPVHLSNPHLRSR